MTDLATRPAPTTNGRGAPRTVARRRSLPGGRAVLGGFLVALSAVGVFSAWTSATRGPTTTYVVVTADVAAGELIERSVLDLVTLELPDAQRRLAFTDIDVLVGAVALAPLAHGQLVQSSDVTKPFGAPDRAQISLRIDAGAAVGGELRPGDVVDVIATYTAGGEPQTKTVARDAQVVKTIADDQRVGAGAPIVVVLAVRPAELEPIASAAAAGHVTIARTTGVARGR
jgi:Flp pilus assembly protein CpaB